MSKRKLKTETEENQKPSAPPVKTPLNLFAETNRGMLLDIVVFLINLFLMRWLSRLFINVVQQASGGDSLAGATLFLFCLAIFTLPPLGATLKRRHFHRRLRLHGRTDVKPGDFMGSCLFNPILFFCLNIVIFAAINAFVMQFIYKNREPDGSVFISSILFGIILVIFQTAVIYRYFSTPKDMPPNGFLQSPLSENLGDACIFLNMILFQVMWNVITMIPMSRPANVSAFAEIIFRLFFLGFAALLIYFPPRIFYLAEDIHRRNARLTILLANLPVILRLLYGAYEN